jgi:large subunit ribosomal protein L4
MTLDVVNAQNEKVGAIDLDDEVFGARLKPYLVWEAVVQQNASERRGTHATKNRALVSGSGKKPWRQKGTGRARVGEVRNPLWRKGGTVFGPQPRSYSFAPPRKVTRGALRSALAEKFQSGAVLVIDELVLPEAKAKAATELLGRLGVEGKTLLVDVEPSADLSRATQNLPRVAVRPSGKVTARDVAGASRVVLSRAAAERLQQVLK